VYGVDVSVWPRCDKVYTREYKGEVLGLLGKSGKSDSELERELGLHPGQMHTWEVTLEKDRAQAFPGVGHQTETEAELRRLRRENDILKKAMVIFTKTQESRDPK
jgi:transposase